tara:strand:- start:4813 stop:6912 length:2100 start_codon:yes stop_codon:yes gene_type:complete
MSELEIVQEDQFEEDAMEDQGGDENLDSVVRLAIEDAVDFIDNTMSPRRAEAADYYEGAPLGNEQEGRSQAQTMDVRDVVQSMLPSLMRIFCGSEKVVEYAPSGPEDIEMAKQATDYVNYVLENDQDQSYIEILYQTFKDALVKGAGILKYDWRETESVESENLDMITDEGLAALNSDENAEITRLDTRMADGIPLHSVTVTRRTINGRVVVASVPPEEFLVNRYARSFSDADIVAHRKYVTVSELVEMGYDFEEMLSFATDDDDFELTNQESRQRVPDGVNRDFQDDQSRKRVLYVEAYMQLDTSGDGVSELRKICTAGPSYEILRNEPADDIPFAFFNPDPEPHAFFGLSVADLVMDIQRIKSAVLRSSLDSLAMSTHPRVGIVEGQASLEDVMNVEAGGVIRMRNPGAVVPFTLPYVGQSAFPMMEYLDQMRENRTGISKAAAGLSPDQLQSSTLAAVTQTISAAQQRIEMVARLFAENGMKRLYKGVLKLVHTYQDQERVIRLRNQFVPVQPDKFSTNMDVVTNIALGAGGNQERLALLGQVAQIQEKLLQQLGPDNPIVNAQNYYNTLVSTLELGGIKDINRYFTDPAQYQPQQPQEPPKPDINEQLIQVQMSEIQANIQKKAAELELEREKMIREDDRRRDETEMNFELKAVEIAAKYNTQIDTASIKANAERDREMVKALSQPPQGPTNVGG